MRFTITGRKITLTPSIETYARQKLLGTVQKLIRDKNTLEAAAVNIELSRITAHHRKGVVWRAGATFKFPGEKRSLFAEVADEDIRAAIDLLTEEIGQIVKKYKGKTIALARRGARRAKKDMHIDSAARMYRQGRIRNEGD